MTNVREIGGEILVLGGGIGAAVGAYCNGQKPWVCLLIIIAVLWMDEVLIRLRKSSDSSKGAR